MYNAFNHVLTFLHCKILNCKRVEDRRWVSLPTTHQCALVAELSDKEIIQTSYNIKNSSQAQREFIVKVGGREVQRAALLTDCYNFKNELVARITIDITTDGESYKLLVAIESARMRVETANGFVTKGLFEITDTVPLDHAPNFWFEGDIQ